MTTPHAKNTDENCTSHLARKPFKRTNTFDMGLLSLMSAAKNSIGQKSNSNINSNSNNNSNDSNSNNSCDMDNSSSSSVERSISLENVSTRSNPF